MIGFISKRLSGGHYRKFLKKCQPVVARINEIEEGYQSLSDEELRAKTGEFKQRYAEALAAAREKAGGKLDEAKEREVSQAALDDLLPEAFAAVKNAARRLCGKEITYAGMKDTWQMVHYDVQLMGGMALHQNMIAEMATGEGKTLVATCPLYLNALTGRNCQLVTVNEFLAQRDSEWMGQIYEFLGLRVACIRSGQPPPEKKQMYAADITYGTASEFGFDYLRDNGMATRKDDQVQRDHYFCIVDEVDSILIDEARTPLIISGPVPDDRDNGEAFRRWKPSIERLVREQQRICNRLVSRAKEELDKDPGLRARPGEKFEGNDPYRDLLQVKLGNPKNKQLMRLLEDGTINKVFESFENEMRADMHKRELYRLKEELLFTVEEKRREADLTEKGRLFLRPDDPDGFVLPDLPTRFMEIDKDDSLDQEAKNKARAEAQERFERVSEEIHTMGQLMRAYSLYERDVEYVVQEGKVMIVDEHTGRVMRGRRWSDGLHQAVESKEGVAIEKETKTYATITLQNYFRLYDKLSGMTGTAETEANEFMDIYQMRVMLIPTHKPNQRIDQNDIIYKTRREKYNAALEEIERVHKEGQPVLVGTVSVESSEVLSRMLRRANITHAVLNAKFHAQEAEIVSRAGQRGAVTIATNMAGRGTDIKLGEGVADLGGLYVLGTERHTSRRIDRQLRGRCARQGDPGTTRFFLSLEDDLLRLYQRGTAGKLLERSFEPGEPLEHPWLNKSIERAQKTVEQQHYSIRRRLLQYDDVLNQQREVIYGLRNDALHNDEPRRVIFELIEEELDDKLDAHGLADLKSGEEPPEQERDAFVAWANAHFPLALKAEALAGLDGAGIRALLLERINKAYDNKASVEDAEHLHQLERYVIVRAIDRQWQDHLTEMDELRQSVSLRSYGQKDPLNEYKNEAFRFFQEMMTNVRGEIASGIFRSATNVAAFQNMLALMSRNARASGPAEAGSTAAAGSGSGGAAVKAPVKRALPSRLPGAAHPGPGLPQVPAKSGPIHLPKFGRNDLVKVKRGSETQTVKYKKAELMIKNDGWQLVGKG